MDYKKHIEVLTELRTARPEQHSERRREAVTAAIELMRAAEPKDSEAEREHCREVVKAFTLGADETFDYPEECREMRSNMRHTLMSERAAARAEGYARAVAEKTVFASTAHVQCMNDLSTAKAEIEWFLQIASERTALADEYATKLTETQAEIERLAKVNCVLIGQSVYDDDRREELQAEIERLRALCEHNTFVNMTTLSTKLVNLRAAAERVRDRGWVTGEDYAILNAAIEASR